MRENFQLPKNELLIIFLSIQAFLSEQMADHLFHDCLNQQILSEKGLLLDKKNCIPCIGIMKA